MAEPLMSALTDEQICEGIRSLYEEFPINSPEYRKLCDGIDRIQLLRSQIDEEHDMQRSHSENPRLRVTLASLRAALEKTAMAATVKGLTIQGYENACAQVVRIACDALGEFPAPSDS
jgi:hypothetical protein